MLGSFTIKIDEIAGAYFIVRVREDGERTVLHESNQWGGGGVAKRYATRDSAERFVQQRWGVDLSKENEHE